MLLVLRGPNTAEAVSGTVAVTLGDVVADLTGVVPTGGTITVTLDDTTADIGGVVVVFLFEPPTKPAGKLYAPEAERRRQGLGRVGQRLFARYDAPARGVSVLKVGGVYVVVDGPTQDEIDDASEVYLGGHVYSVDGVTATALTAAGFDVEGATGVALGALAVTLDDVTALFESFTVDGYIDVTLAASSSAMTGGVGLAGTLTVTLDSAVASMDGSLGPATPSGFYVSPSTDRLLTTAGELLVQAP